MYKHTHARLAHMGGHVQTNAYQYCQHQLRHNTTGRKEAAADVNTVCRGWGGVVDSACVGWWIRERPDKGAHCSALLKTPVSVASLLISASS